MGLRVLLLAVLITGCAAATYDTHDDLTLSTHVKIALIDDARLGQFRINAATSHGVVTLEGTVPSQPDADRAIAIARKVRGVRDVKSDLKVGGRLPVVPGSQVPGFQDSGSRFSVL